MDQVQEYGPPPNPAKLTDSRVGSYLDEYGDESWELDALDPATLSALIEDEVLALRDEDLWADVVEEEERHTELLTLTSRRWADVVEMLEGAS
jgi:chromosome condensin MukBEF complex kleisin-like MukF subunit